MSGPMIKRTRDQLQCAPLPECPAELEVLSLWYFGKALHLSRLSVYGNCAQYEVAEMYNDYHGKGWLFGQSCVIGYDYSRDFWAHVIGQLYCGGIASRSYGQVNVVGHRNVARLKRLEGYLRRKEPGRLRSAFVRLARDIGAGENTVTMDNGVLIAGRVDGAAAASIEANSP